MIGTIDIKVNAAHPEMPLAPFYAFINSPSQVRVINVPKTIGNWKISKVYVTANYPDNQSVSVEATLTGGCWHATLAASTSTGTSTNGFTITANGVKEDGTTAVTGYVLGKGDCYILATDGTITVGDTTYYVHLVDSQPTTPKKGDLCAIDGVWKVYTGSAWSALGSATTIDWDDIENKPSTFPPETHTHTKSQITDFPESMTPTAHASAHATGGTDAITPSSIGAAAESHTHSGYVQKSGDTMSGVLNVQARISVADSYVLTQGAIVNYAETQSLTLPLTKTGTLALTSDISNDVSHAKSISATGVATACTPDANGDINVSTLFSSTNTSNNLDNIRVSASDSTSAATLIGQKVSSSSGNGTIAYADNGSTLKFTGYYGTGVALKGGNSNGGRITNILGESSSVDVFLPTTAGTLAVTAELPYGYVSIEHTGSIITAQDGKINRIYSTGYTYLTSNPSVSLPVPASGKITDLILRFNTGTTACSPTISLASGTATSFSISGDTVEASGSYEMMCNVVPTATSGTYEVITTTRKLS